MASIIRDVMGMDESQRRAIEDVLGQKLGLNQRLVISVQEIGEGASPSAERPRQTLADWQSVYEGLDDDGVARVHEIATSRANLTRDLP